MRRDRVLKSAEKKHKLCSVKNEEAVTYLDGNVRGEFNKAVGAVQGM